MKQKFIRLTAFLLLLFIIIGTVPVYAEPTETSDGFESGAVEEGFSIEAKDEIQLKLELEELVFEIESLREENVKHFRLEDGTYQAVVYGQAVHRKDAAGIWQDIDNNLAVKNVLETVSYTTADSRVSFAQSVSGGSKIFTLGENGYSVSLSLLNNEKTNQSSAAVTNHAKRSEQLAFDSTVSKLDRLKTVDNKTSVLYKNVFDNIDIEYLLVSNSIKENIIVNGISEDYSYSFVLELGNLAAVCDGDGRIYLYGENGDKPEYIIPAPYMYDADGETSYDVFYELNDIGGGKYKLTVTADSQWINKDNRAFPVVIDPTISSSQLSWDTFVNSSAVDENYGSWGVWVDSGYTAFIKNDMPSLPSGATISYASLNVAYYYFRDVVGSRTIGAYKMNQSWSEYSVTYNTLFNTYGTSLGVDSSKLSERVVASNPNITSLTPSWLSFSVTGLRGSHTGTIIFPWDASTIYTAYYTITYNATSTSAPLADGIYSFKNKHSGYFMDIAENSPAIGTYMQQYAYGGTTPATEENRSGLFKVTLVSGNEYIIRTMRNNGVGFSPVSSNAGAYVTTQYIPSTNGDVPDDLRWTITSDGGYLIIRPKNNSTYALCVQGKSSGGGATSSAPRLVLQNKSDDYAKWTAASLSSSVTMDGLLNVTPYRSSINLGNDYQDSAYMWSTTMTRNGPVTWSVTNGDNTATDKATIDASSGILSTVKVGNIRVKATYAGAPWLWVRNVTINPYGGASHTTRLSPDL